MIQGTILIPDNPVVAKVTHKWILIDQFVSILNSSLRRVSFFGVLTVEALPSIARVHVLKSDLDLTCENLVLDRPDVEGSITMLNPGTLIDRYSWFTDRAYVTVGRASGPISILCRSDWIQVRLVCPVIDIFVLPKTLSEHKLASIVDLVIFGTVLSFDLNSSERAQGRKEGETASHYLLKILLFVQLKIQN